MPGAGRPGRPRRRPGGRLLQGHAAAARAGRRAGRPARSSSSSTSRPARWTRSAGPTSATCVLSLKARGVAVLLNSHLIGEVERVCDRVVILDKGRVAASGTLAELLGQRELRLRLDRRDAAGARRGWPPPAGSTAQRRLVHRRAAGRRRRRRRCPTSCADLVALGVRVHAVEPGADQPRGAAARHPAAPEPAATGDDRPDRRSPSPRSPCARRPAGGCCCALGGAHRRAARRSAPGASPSWPAWTSTGTLTSGEARLVASQRAQPGDVRVQPDRRARHRVPRRPDAGRRDRSRASRWRCWPGRSAARRCCWASGWAWWPSAAASSSLAGLGPVPRRPGDRRTTGRRSRSPASRCSRRRRSCCSPWRCCCRRVISPMASGIVAVGLFGATWVAGVVGGVGEALGNDGRGAGRHRVADAAAHRRAVARRDARLPGPVRAAHHRAAAAAAFPFLSATSLSAGLPGLGGGLGAVVWGLAALVLPPPGPLATSARWQSCYRGATTVRTTQRCLPTGRSRWKPSASKVESAPW